jgi:hypothetical protein
MALEVVSWLTDVGKGDEFVWGDSDLLINIFEPDPKPELYALSEPGTKMHSGSGSEFMSESDIKWNKKKVKSKDIKKVFLNEKFAKYRIC